MPEQFVIIGAMALAIATLVVAQNLARYLLARDWNGAAGIALACVLGILVALWFANSDATEGLVLIQDGKPIGDYDFATIAMIGVVLGAGGSFGVDILKAINNGDTARKPPLVSSGGSEQE